MLRFKTSTLEVRKATPSEEDRYWKQPKFDLAWDFTDSYGYRNAANRDSLYAFTKGGYPCGVVEFSLEKEDDDGKTARVVNMNVFQYAESEDTYVSKPDSRAIWKMLLKGLADNLANSPEVARICARFVPKKLLPAFNEAGFLVVGESSAYQEPSVYEVTKELRRGREDIAKELPKRQS